MPGYINSVPQIGYVNGKPVKGYVNGKLVLGEEDELPELSHNLYVGVDTAIGTGYGFNEVAVPPYGDLTPRTFTNDARVITNASIAFVLGITSAGVSTTGSTGVNNVRWKFAAETGLPDIVLVPFDETTWQKSTGVTDHYAYLVANHGQTIQAELTIE